MNYKYKNVSGIYIVRNSINDRVYIGSAVSIYNRYHLHKLHLLRGNHANSKLQRFVNKYGFDKLSFDVLELCGKLDLIKREQYYLDTYKPYFNICTIAGNTLGFKMSKETLRHLSEVRKGKQSTGMLGKHHNDATKRIIALKAKKRGIPHNCLMASILSNTGRKHSVEWRNKIAEKQRKLTDKQVNEIRKKLKDGIYQYIIAKQYGVSQRLIVRVNLGLGVYSK